ncbi:hypothetical protein ENZ74_32170, partial [Mesorhizobium sp. M7A.F.Ca.CA.002.15.2.1]
YGGGAPVVVQSMTNTDTADIDQTVAQVAALHRADALRSGHEVEEQRWLVNGDRSPLARIGTSPTTKNNR